MWRKSRLELETGLSSGKEIPYFSSSVRGRHDYKQADDQGADQTIPQPVRTALRLKEGDEIAYIIAQEHVVITKAIPAPADDPFATFDEWDGEADRKAYAEL